jgi:hypothetical protein
MTYPPSENRWAILSSDAKKTKWSLPVMGEQKRVTGV